MKLVLLLFISVTANAATLGSSNCSHGPAYWCESMVQAKACGAVQYCLDNNWPNIKAMVGNNGDQCTHCTDFFGDVKSFLNNATVEQMIARELDQLCEYMGSYKDECKLLISTVVPQLVQKFNPKEVCTDIGFCKSSLLGIEGALLTPPSNDDCSDCQKFMTDVKTYLSNATVQSMLLAELEAICQDLGSFEQQCKDDISKYGGLVFELLLQYFVPKDVCIDLGFCQSSLISMVPDAPSNDNCEDCKAFIGDIQNDLSNTTIQKLIINELNTLCNSLGSLAPQCQSYVTTYGPLVLSTLAEYMDPNVVCVDIGLCKTEDAPRKLNDNCKDCKAFIGDIQNDLSNTTIQKLIINELNTLCNSLGPLAPQCQSYVTFYGPLVLNTLAEYMDPNVVCADVGFCQTENAPRKLRFSSNDQCLDCTTAVKGAVILLRNPEVQKAIINQVEKVCDDFGEVGPQCRQYVESYAPVLFDLALQYMTPSAVCSALGLCTGMDADAFAKSNLLL